MLQLLSCSRLDQSALCLVEQPGGRCQHVNLEAPQGTEAMFPRLVEPERAVPGQQDLAVAAEVVMDRPGPVELTGLKRETQYLHYWRKRSARITHEILITNDSVARVPEGLPDLERHRIVRRHGAQQFQRRIAAEGRGDLATGVAHRVDRPEVDARRSLEPDEP